MSSLYAIAAVTTVLKDLLNNGLIDGDVATAVSDNVVVSSLPPNRIPGGNGEERSQLNLFLYRVTPNSGWRNAGLPARDHSGHPLGRDPLVVDLHYLLTAYGADELHAEILLGYGMQLLHETPVIPREQIDTSLASPGLLDDAADLPPTLRAIAGSALSQQVEQIKITPADISVEDLSKLWTSFQAPFRPSAGYHISAVMIESRRPPARGLPVRARNLTAIPFQRPTITRLLSQPDATTEASPHAPILPGHILLIRGRDLTGEQTHLRIGNRTYTPPPDNLGETEILFTIPDDLPAGLHPLSVFHEVTFGDPPVTRPSAESNPVALVLRPQFQRLPDDSYDLTVTDLEIDGSTVITGLLSARVSPGVRRRQRVELVLNEYDPPATRTARRLVYDANPPVIPEDEEETEMVAFPIRNLPVATYLLRIRVDGAESPLVHSTDPAEPGYVQPRISLGP